MSAVDIIIILVICVAAITGFTKGAIRQIGSTAGVVAGFIAARLFGAQVGLILRTTNPEGAELPPVVQEIMGCIIVFLAVWIAVFIIVRLVRGIIKVIGLSFLDRLGGALLMVLKWLLGISVVMNIWYFFAPESSVFSSSAIFGGSILRFIMNLFPWLMGLLNY